MNMSWKLLPLAAVFALGLLALMPGGATLPPSARADIDRVSAEDLSIESGDSTDITIVAEDQDGDVTVRVTSVAAGTTAELELRDCDGCDEEDEENATELSIDSDDSDFPNNGVLEVRLTLTCEDRDPVRVRVEQGGDHPSVVVTCNPEGNIVIGNSADDDDSVDFDFEISGDSSCRDDFTLADNDEMSFKCDTDDETYTITEDVPEGWELIEIDCDDENVPSRDIDVDIDDASVTIELSDENDSVDCTFINQLEETGSPNSVVLTASTTTPACGLPIVVLATVKDQGGNLLEDVTVIFTAPRGTFTTQAGTTSSGKIATLYTPPNTGSAPIIITVTAGGVVGTLPIQLSCAVATPTVTATAVTSPPIIRPPSTGDAGLAETSGSSWTLLGIAGALAFVVAAVGMGTPKFFRC